MFNTGNLSIVRKQSVIFALICMALFAGNTQGIYAQAPRRPVPAEVFFGNEYIYYQFVTKRAFSPDSNFEYFMLATFSADYQNVLAENSMVMIGQISYDLGQGFGLMGGADVNSFSGFSPVVGPQHTYASKEWLTVTVLSYFLNGESDLKLFGLYEYKPALTERWSLYNRVQFIVNESLKYESHNKSYLYLRTGLKRNSLIIGVAANFDWSGPNKVYRDNFGLFTRWEFQ
jgi:hypothetical protein